MTANTTTTAAAADFTVNADLNTWTAGLLRNRATGKITAAARDMVALRAALADGDAARTQEITTTLNGRVWDATAALVGFSGHTDQDMVRSAVLQATGLISVGADAAEVLNGMIERV